MSITKLRKATLPCIRVAIDMHPPRSLAVLVITDWLSALTMYARMEFVSLVKQDRLTEELTLSREWAFLMVVINSDALVRVFLQPYKIVRL